MQLQLKTLLSGNGIFMNQKTDTNNYNIFLNTKLARLLKLLLQNQNKS